MNLTTTTEDVEDDPVLYTRGVASTVYVDGDEDSHVLLLDLDDVPDDLGPHTLASELDGFSALWRSSEGSFHLWVLDPRPLTDAIMDGLSVRLADSEHVAQSRRRERYVVRHAPKVREDGSIYKSAPELVGIYDDGTGDVARGHLALIDSAPDIEDGRLYGDETVETHSYMTVTDEAKGELR